MDDSGGENYLTCPYDPLHKIRPMRIQNHVLKCRKKYPNQKCVPCKWNEYHRVFEMELKHHEESCSDRNPPSLQAQAARPVAPPEISARNKQHRIDAEGDEDWDPELKAKEIAEGSQTFSYPRNSADGLYIGYQPKNMTKTEKKAWRAQQRPKFQHRLETDPVFASQYVTEPPEELMFPSGRSESSSMSGGGGGAVSVHDVNNGDINFNDGQSSLGDAVSSASALTLHPILEEEADSDQDHNNNAQGEDSQESDPELEPEPVTPAIKTEEKIDAIPGAGTGAGVAQETDTAGTGAGAGLIKKNETENQEEEDDEFFDAQSQIALDLEDLASDLTDLLTFQ